MPCLAAPLWGKKKESVRAKQSEGGGGRKKNRPRKQEMRTGPITHREMDVGRHLNPRPQNEEGGWI